jgi:dihydrofolate reductase
MTSLSAFMNISLDGCIADAKGDMSAFHQLHGDPEFQAFTQDNAKGGGRLVFGRKTYDMMASYWPTPAALQQNPLVASQMNNMPKIVFSRTMAQADWSNTTLAKGDFIAAVKKLKDDDGPDMVTLGSGSIVTQLSETGLLDELQVVVNPVAFGAGTRLFDGAGKRFDWRMTETRAFKNGCIFVRYTPL